MVDAEVDSFRLQGLFPVRIRIFSWGEMNFQMTFLRTFLKGHLRNRLEGFLLWPLLADLRTPVLSPLAGIFLLALSFFELLPVQMVG